MTDVTSRRAPDRTRRRRRLLDRSAPDGRRRPGRGLPTAPRPAGRPVPMLGPTGSVTWAR